MRWKAFSRHRYFDSRARSINISFVLTGHLLDLCLHFRLELVMLPDSQGRKCPWKAGKANLGHNVLHKLRYPAMWRLGSVFDVGRSSFVVLYQHA